MLKCFAQYFNINMTNLTCFIYIFTVIHFLFFLKELNHSKHHSKCRNMSKFLSARF